MFHQHSQISLRPQALLKNIDPDVVEKRLKEQEFRRDKIELMKEAYKLS